MQEFEYQSKWKELWDALQVAVHNEELAKTHWQTCKNRAHGARTALHNFEKTEGNAVTPAPVGHRRLNINNRKCNKE